MSTIADAMKRNFDGSGFGAGGYSADGTQGDAQRVKREYSESERAARFKTKHCKFFSVGKCSKGSSCPYIHDAASPSSFGVGSDMYAPVPVVSNVAYRAGAYGGVSGGAMPYDPYALASPSMPPPAGTPVNPNDYYDPYAESNGGTHASVAQMAPAYAPAYPPVYAPYGAPAALPPPSMAPIMGTTVMAPVTAFGATPTIASYAPPGMAMAGGPPIIKPFPPGRFKTQQCKFWPQGKCSRGANCTYLHGDADPDKNQAPPSHITVLNTPRGGGGSYKGAGPLPGGGGAGAGSEEKPVRFKVKPCRFFAAGQCVKGEGCSYIHSTESVAPLSQVSAEQQQPHSPTNGVGAPSDDVTPETSTMQDDDNSMIPMLSSNAGIVRANNNKSL